MLLGEGHCLRDHALALGGGKGMPPGEFQASSLHTLVQMVDNGLGVTMLPEMALEAGMAPDRISFAGPGKRTDELTAAIFAGVTINLESEGEARRAIAAGAALAHALSPSVLKRGVAWVVLVVGIGILVRLFAAQFAMVN